MSQLRRGGLVVALALGAANLASAQTSNTLVTFSVDMSSAFNAGYFVLGTDTVAARGTFNGYGQFFLTNDPVGSNPYLFSGTLSDTTEANGSKMQYKFWTSNASAPNTGWEGTVSGQNRCVLLPATSGASLVLPTPFYGDGGLPEISTVTFQVDMAQQINVGAFHPATDILDVRGHFNSWSGSVNVLTNDPTILRTNQYGLVTSNVFVTTVDVAASHAAAEGFKFVIQPSNWENPSAINSDGGGNRYFTSIPQTLPIVFFADAAFAPVATLNVKFQVDMTAQVIAGVFDPIGGYVQVRGEFTSWGSNPVTCTNDPSSANTNLYTAVIPITNGVGVVEQYKFWASVLPNSGWETTPNRSFTMVNASSLTLPTVFFNDTDPADLLPADTVVTFSVSMTNAVGTDGHAFNAQSDAVYINGPPNGFLGWGTSLPLLTNNPTGSEIYSVDLLIPKGSPVMQTYKYGINGSDNEAAVNSNHVRPIRTTGTYAMPLDQFGNQYAEPSFGNLLASRAASGHALISWLGRPGVHLQTRTNLTTAPWVDHMETDGLSSTNWPAGSGNLYFRLIRP